MGSNWKANRDWGETRISRTKGFHLGTVTQTNGMLIRPFKRDRHLQ